MTTLGPSSDITGASTTNAQAKAWFSMIRTFISDLLGSDSANNAAALAAMKALLNGSLPKSGAYTVAAADRGKVITCTGTWTLSLTAAATLGDGFPFGVWNTGSGTITIDPNLSELIDGGTTKAIGAGQLVVIYGNGTSFVTVGGMTFNGRSGAVTLTADDVTGVGGALAANVVSKDAGDLGVGLPRTLFVSTGSVAAGATVAGSNLRIAIVNSSGQFVNDGIGITGTWRNVSNRTVSPSGPCYAGDFQRIS